MKRRLLPVALCLAVAASFQLGCSDTRSTAARGLPRFVSLTGTGVESSTALEVDFGRALVGATVEREVRLRNEGRVPFTVTGVRRSEELRSSFGDDLSPPFDVGAGEEAALKVRFHPPAPGPASGVLSLEIANGDQELLVVELGGTGVDSQCQIVPDQRLGFAATARGGSNAAQVKVLNPSALSWKVSVGEPDSGPDVGAFRFAMGFVAGDHEVPAAVDGVPGELVIPMAFWPARLGKHQGLLPIAGPGLCSRDLLLEGEGLEHLLTCEPTAKTTSGGRVCQIDFGYVDLGVKVVRAARLGNRGPSPVTVTLSSLTQPDGSSPFSIETEEQQLTIPAGGAEVEIPLGFQPDEVGRFRGKLRFQSDDASRPNDVIELVGAGGGPRLEVYPVVLEFGPVAKGTYVGRRLALTNVGTDVPGTTDDNLKAVAYEDGEWVEARPILEGRDADAFELVWPPAAPWGEHGLAAGQSADLLVRFAPATEGRKEATIRIFSNDLSRPLPYEVPLGGEAVNLPPCSFTVEPPALTFGSVESGRHLTQYFSIVNHAADEAHECLVSALDLTRATIAQNAFQLVDGAKELVRIPGGKSHRVAVRFVPKANGAFAGEVEFYVNATPSRVTIPLSGLGESSCVTLVPRELDFGTLGVGCWSIERTVSLYNNCSKPVEVRSIGLTQTSSQEPFSLVGKPGVPYALSSGARLELKLTYQPKENGSDSATLAVTVRNTADSTYAATILGAGATTPDQTDIFSQGSRPKVDLLLVIDDSCSMSSHQANLSANMTTFMEQTLRQKVDFHIAVTTASWNVNPGDNYVDGRFLPLDNSSPRVITSTTPDRERILKERVRVGTGGFGPIKESLIWPAYAALTPPRSETWNAGFYRDDARLAIVAVSDTEDYDVLKQPVSFYEAFFLNLKGSRRRSEISFNAILPTLPSPPPGCSYQGNFNSEGDRAKELVKRTGGVMDDICTPDWAETLAKMGDRVFGVWTTFFLTNSPDLGAKPITVEVNGQDFPATGVKGETRWWYDSQNNAIVFDPLAAPDPGSVLAVTYRVACLGSGG